MRRRAALVARHIDDFLSFEQVAAAGGMIEAAEGIHERGFTGAGWAHEGHVFAAFDVQRDVAQGIDLDFAEGVYFSDVAQLDQGHIEFPIAFPVQIKDVFMSLGL